MVSKQSIIAILGCISQIALSQTNQDAANDRANEGALKLIGNIPRYGGDSELDKDDFSGEPTYWIGVASLVAIPLIFLGLSVLLCPLWTICRCCKCCCCKKTKPKDEITKCQIYGPYFLVFGCVVAIVYVSFISIFFYLSLSSFFIKYLVQWQQLLMEQM